MQIIKINTVNEAIQYIKDNNILYEEARQYNTWNSDEVNIVWWKDLKFDKSDEGMKKVAHFNSKQKVLAIY